MKSNQTLQTRPSAGSPALQSAVRIYTLIVLAFAVSSSLAQTVSMRSQPLRFTIAKGVASSNFCTLTIPVSGLANEGVDTVNLAVTGVPGSGAAAAFLSTNGLTSNLTYTATLILTNDATIAAGDYDLAVEATGAASFRLPVPVQVAYIWSGSDFTNSVSTNWSSAGNWVGGVVPSATDAIIFSDGGGQANAPGPTNIIVTSDTQVASVRFGPQANGSRAHNMEIQSGASLIVSGPGLSFSLHRDSKLVAQQILATISGGGTLMVTNANAEIGVLLDGQQNCTWDMRNLNSFVADVSRIGLGNHRIWPNYYTNGYVGSGGANIQNPPTRFVPLVWLAKTNIIKCSWTDPNNYNDPGIRDYALEIGNDEAAGTTAAIRFSLGNSNAFFLDSICWSHSGKGAGGNNYNFTATNSYALFRGIGGGRMSVWAQGDASGVGASQSNVRGNTCDFSSGAVDAMIDRMLLGRSRTNIGASMTIQATLTIGGNYPSTVFDVNTAILGYQDVDNQGTTSTTVSGPSATVNVNSNATLKVNGDLHLGYTTAAAAGSYTFPENCAGTLNINNSGTVMASNILAGGVTKLSVNNNISVNNGGKLIVTNLLGASDARINNFTLANNAQLTLLGVAVGQTAIYARTFAAATPCSISIPAIAGYVSGTVTIPLISYQTASPVISGLTVTPPAGLFTLSVVDDGAGTINVTFGDRVPQTLVWRGNVSSDWNTTDQNWVTQIGGFQTNFFDGDSVVFDDSVGAGPTTITISSPVAPGQLSAPYGIVVSNASYTFSSGSIIGAATLRKTGTGNLTINATLSPGILLNQGSLAGVGTVGPTTLENGTTMTGFSGTINGGLTASNATASISGSVNGGLKLLAGSLDNAGTISGTFNLATNVTLNNALGAILNVTLPWSVPTNSTLINNGDIFHFGTSGGNLGLTVNGTLKGIGRIVQNGLQFASDVRVTVNPGGQLIIGNAANEITNVTIAVRLDLIAGSLTTFDVNNSGALPVNDKIVLDATPSGFGKVNFGTGNNLGATLLINKTVGPAFSAATILYPFDQVANQPDNGQPAIPQIVPVPAPGLVWNTYNVITNLTLAVTLPPQVTNSITSTNLVFEWPADYRGWRLERQTNSLAVGLDWSGTNWTTVFTALAGTNVLYYPDITNSPDVYWIRQVQTIDRTNPAVFYRVTYP